MASKKIQSWYLNSGLPENRTQILPCTTQTKGPEPEHCQDIETSRANQTGNLRAARDLKDHLRLFIVPKVSMGKLPRDVDSFPKITQENSGSPRTKTHLEGMFSCLLKLEGRFPGRAGLSGLRSLPGLFPQECGLSQKKASPGPTGR